MINDCHALAADGLTVVTVMTLFNHLWFLFSLENSVCKILLKFWQSDRKTRIAGANLILTTPRSSWTTDPARKCRDWLLPRPTGPPPSFSPAGLTISLHLTPGQHVSLGFFVRNGHHEVVEYLVDRCCASVEQVRASRTRYCQAMARLSKIWSIVQDIVDYPKCCRLSKILSIIQDIVDYSIYYLRRAASPLTGKRSRELLLCGALLQQVTSISEEQ